MKKLFLATFLVVIQAASAQNATNIIGKWAYSDLHDKSSVDETGQQMAAMIFSKLIINFRADNTMSLTMSKKPEQGTYTFDKEKENLILTVSETGKAMPMTIIKLTDNELILTFGDLGAMIMTKVSAEPDVAPPVPSKIAVTAQQISHKWFVTGNEDKKMTGLSAELMKDSYVEFSPNGKYTAEILSIEQTGTWKFGDGNTTILVDTEDGKGIWSIYAISEDDLTMKSDSSVLRMTFSKKQL